MMAIMAPGRVIRKVSKDAMDRCIWIVFSLLYFSSFAEAEAV
jgi:hypothetical protein